MKRILFINELCSAFELSPENVFTLGREHGWLEYEDELFCNDEITRKQAARIIHMFLLKEKGLSDIQDISRAEVLRDLYDCRVCANHVAQVYLRGIMNAEKLDNAGNVLWFDLDGIEEDSVLIESVRRSVIIANKRDQ